MFEQNAHGVPGSYHGGRTPSLSVVEDDRRWRHAETELAAIPAAGRKRTIPTCVAYSIVHASS
jgi:hypothetical protein